MASKGIELMILELVDLGYSERKILNRLKDIKNELVTEKDCSVADNKEYNKLINGMLFGGKFDIKQPTTPLLGLVKQIKKVKGSEFTYYLLSTILMSGWFYNGIYEKNDLEKSNLLMFHIKDKIEVTVRDFEKANKSVDEPF